MSRESLSDFVAELEDDGEIVRVRAEVDPHLELAAVVERVVETNSDAHTGGGPAVFFENVRGSRWPVVANLLGNRHRICRMLGVESLDEVTARFAGLIEPELPDGWLDALRLAPQYAKLAKLPPKTVASGACQQVVKMGGDVDMAELPAPQCWPNESGRTITAGLLITRSLETGARSVESVPLELLDGNRLAVHWTVQDRGRAYFSEYQSTGKQMPAAVALGGDPVLDFAARTPLPPQTDPFFLAGVLRGDNVPLVGCRSIELEVPAGADAIVEGYIDATAKLESAGPVAGPFGFYTEHGEAPVLNVNALTHRSNPIFPAVVPSRSFGEADRVRRAVDEILLPFTKLYVPELVALAHPHASAGRNLLFVAIRKQYAGQARKVMSALWSLEQFYTTKCLVVVDDDVDVLNEDAVWFHVGMNVHPARDVVTTDGPAHPHDHAAPVRGMGAKLGLDATRKLKEEGHPREWPDRLETSNEVQQKVEQRWREYGVGQ